MESNAFFIIAFNLPYSIFSFNTIKERFEVVLMQQEVSLNKNAMALIAFFFR